MVSYVAPIFGSPIKLSRVKIPVFCVGRHAFQESNLSRAIEKTGCRQSASRPAYNECGDQGLSGRGVLLGQTLQSLSELVDRIRGRKVQGFCQNLIGDRERCSGEFAKMHPNAPRQIICSIGVSG